MAPNWEEGTKTATLYGALTPADMSSGTILEGIASDLARANLRAFEFPNTFERVIDRVFPLWSATRKALEDATEARFWLTGAGPSLYALAASLDEAERIAEQARPLGHQVVVTQLEPGVLRLRDDSC